MWWAGRRGVWWQVVVGEGRVWREGLNKFQAWKNQNRPEKVVQPSYSAAREEPAE